MKNSLFGIITSFLLAGVFSTGLLFGQEHPADHSGEPAKAASAEVPVIFCPTMKTGQLCSHGTADALRLSTEKRERWVEAARRYNKAVNVATNQLLKETGPLLSPEEHALLETWFAKGLNPQINRILASKK
jgi:hypothetical protein